MADTAVLRTVITLPLLLYASYLDVRHREIESRIWQGMTLMGFSILLIEVWIWKNPRLLVPFAFSLFFATIFSLSLYYLGLTGGGDAKMLIGLGAMYPLLPGGSFVFPLLFLSVFTNAVLLALLIPLLFFMYNMRHLKDIGSIRDFLRLFIAYKKEAHDIGRFETVLEGKQIFLNIKNVELGKTDEEGVVWVTPALPFAVFLTAGFLISTFYGDLIHLIL